MGLVINKHNDASKARFTLVDNPNGKSKVTNSNGKVASYVNLSKC
jgi:hypothetical protein